MSSHCDPRYRAALGYNFDYSYTSHAHGWSTGPTSALTFYVLGLQITEPRGSSWTLAPHFSGLTEAEGGFTTSLGWFGAHWEIEGGQNVTVSVSAPLGTRGTIEIPGNVESLHVDGEETVVQGGKLVVDGGNHTLFARL